jgi:hypothetical protein
MEFCLGSNNYSNDVNVRDFCTVSTIVKYLKHICLLLTTLAVL